MLQFGHELFLVIDVADLVDRSSVGGFRFELLWDGLGGVSQFWNWGLVGQPKKQTDGELTFEQLGGDSQVVDTGQSLDFANVSERSTHDDGLVSVLLVVVEDVLDRLDSRVLLASVIGVRVLLLVPVEDSTDEGRDQGGTSLGTGDGLTETEEQGQVAVNVLVGLQVSGGLDTFPGGSDLDQDSLSLNTDGFVEGDQLLGLVDSGLGVVGQGGVNFGGDSTGDDLEDLSAEFNKESVGGVLDLGVNVTSLLLGVLDGDVNESGVTFLLGGGQNQGGVGSGILGLVDVDG